MLAYVTENFGYGDGGSQSATDVLISLLANRYPVVVASRNKYTLPVAVGGTPIVAPPWVQLPLEDRFSVATDLWRRHRVQRTLARSSPRLVIHNSFPPPDSFVHARVGTWGRGLMIVRCLPGFFDFPERYDQRYTLDWAIDTMQLFDALVFVSPRAHAEWQMVREVGEKKSFCVPNCCREEEVAEVASAPRSIVRRRLGFPEDRFIMVCVASLQPHKGQDLLVDAFPRMKKIAPDLLLYFVGWPSNQAYAAKLRKEVESQGIADHVRFTGLRKDVLQTMYAADLLVSPSRSEAFGLVNLEAMALRTPVLAARSGGIQDLVVDGDTGLLFDIDDAEGMIDGFRRMYQSEGLRSAFADRAHDRFRTCFSRAQQIRRYGEVVDEMLASPAVEPLS